LYICMNVQDILQMESLQFDDVSYIFMFRKDGIPISANCFETLYLLQGLVQKSLKAHLWLTKYALQKANLWHQYYGHFCISNLKKFKNDKFVCGFELNENLTLEFCENGECMANNIKTKFPKMWVEGHTSLNWYITMWTN